MLRGDSRDAAEPSVKLLNDPRVRHFYDPQQAAGKMIADSIGWNGKVAWDIYLFYPPDVEWSDAPPAPADMMHQLTDTWANQDCFRTGADLTHALYQSLSQLL